MFSLPVPVHVRQIQFDDLTLLKYTKPLNDPTMGVYRSVVVCSEKVRCVAPPKAVSLDEFVAKYPIETVKVDEFVDGTMVNAFYKDKWVLCTKSNVGASNGFLEGAPSFAEMFKDAANVTGIDLDKLDKNCCYSFVLQHPQNRIVTPVKIPKLFLIKCYSINGRNVVENSCFSPVPVMHTMASYEEVQRKAKELPFSSKGFMLHAPDGTRSKVLGEAYMKVSLLRGSDASMKFRILKLREHTDLEELLSYYPELRMLAADTKAALRRFTNELYTMYLDCYRHKTKPFKEYPREFKPHLFALHELYLSTWPSPIHKKRVVAYVATLHPAQLCSMK
jgi:hypothetical protein